MSEIKVGDTVRLKSGSPLMTVESITNMGTIHLPIMKAACSWFEGTKVSNALFVLESLELDNDED